MKQIDMGTENEVLTLEQLSPEQLGIFINDLVERDFSRLVQILYRLDVSEEKLKTVLLEHPTGNAGDLIAALIIDRMEQSRKTKEQFKQPGEIPEDEKW